MKKDANQIGTSSFISTSFLLQKLGFLTSTQPTNTCYYLLLKSFTRGNTMPHTIVTNTCEGIADCVDACPVACIHEGPGKNSKGTDWYWIDFATCIDCGICLQVCPVDGAIVPEERPELQKTPG
jgi:NAD-dependent dihydropyrimidine dehydrogenase PreA subunit